MQEGRGSGLKPTLVKSQPHDFWIASCDIGSIGLAICSGPRFLLLDYKGEIIWDKTLGGSTSIGSFSKYFPMLIVGSFDGGARAFDYDGALLKEIVFSYPVYAISETPESILICTGQYVFLLDKDWQELWRHKMPFYIKSCDVGDEGNFVFGAKAGPAGGLLTQIDPDGSEIWKKEFRTNVLVSRYIKINEKEQILFGTRDGYWGFLDKVDGSKILSSKSKKSILCAQQTETGFIIGGRDQTLREFSVEEEKIQEKWKLKFKDVVYCFKLKNFEDLDYNLLIGTLDHFLHYYKA